MSVNKVILVGNVGKDPDVKYFDNGSVVASFSLATTEKGYTSQSGVTVPDRTEWHNIVCWRGLAKVAEQYVKKGTQVYIEGKIRSRSYDDANGVKRYVTEIYADNLQLLGSKSNNTGEPNSQQPNNQQPSSPSSPQFSQDDDDGLPF